MAYIYDLTDTWNAGGTVFNAIKMNVTDSASAVTSKLVSLQTNGTEHFSVTKAGVGYFSGNVGIGTSSPISGAGLTVGNDGTSSATVKQSFSTSTTERAFISINGSSGEMRYSAGYSGYGGFSTFYTAGSECMRIDASGNVGIGTSSPGYKLQVNGTMAGVVASGANYSAIRTSDFYYMTVSADGLNTLTDANGSAPMLFRTGGTERMRIDSSGNLLVGTTSFTAGANGMQIRSFGQVDISRDTTATADHMTFNNPNGKVGSISTSASATAYNTSSDVRLKRDIIDAPEASSLIDAIQVRSFKWNADNTEQRYGFVAQELLEVAPEAVSQPADPEEMMGVDYSKLVPMLVKEIQSLRARVAQLEGN